MSRRDFDLLSEWRISVPAPQPRAAPRSQSVPPTRRQESRQIETVRTEPAAPQKTAAVAPPSAQPSTRAKSTARSRDPLLCVNCVNKSLIEDRQTRERRLRQEAVVLEQKTLRENEERLRRERDTLMQRKKAMAEDLQEFLATKPRQSQQEDRVVGGGLLTSPSASSRDILKQQREYREALLRQISQERTRKVEQAEVERRLEAEGLRRLQAQNSASASTSASMVQAQRSELRKSLLTQMKEKLTQREEERATKANEMQFMKSEEARYYEVMRQRMEQRRIQTQEIASTLAQQLKRKEKRDSEATGTSLQISHYPLDLQACTNCNRVVPRPYMTRPQWI